jgi:ectoine hydroxylase
MRRPDAVNIAIPLDEMHKDNGPLLVVPGSHRVGVYDLDEAQRRRGRNWSEHVSSSLTYTLSEHRVTDLLREHGSKEVTGPAGSIFAFHPSIVHSSSNNRSSDRRALLLVTYNRVDNAPTALTRPEFLVSRNTEPLKPGHDDRLGLIGLRP